MCIAHIDADNLRGPSASDPSASVRHSIDSLPIRNHHALTFVCGGRVDYKDAAEKAMLGTHDRESKDYLIRKDESEKYSQLVQRLDEYAKYMEKVEMEAYVLMIRVALFSYG